LGALYPFGPRGNAQTTMFSLPLVGAVADLSRFCGLWAMEAGWISALVDGRAPFFWFRVKVWWKGT
jgi:hypothetical protein